MSAAKTLLFSPSILKSPTPKSPKPSRFTPTRIRSSSSSSQQTLTQTLSTTPAKTRVKILSEALPFIQRFRGKTVVVKYGGAAMKSEALQASVIADLVLLSCIGLRIVFVHGGGPEINQWLNRLGIQSSFLNGLRVTDASTMEIVSMVLVGKVNKHLVGLINKAGATAVGLCGTDGRIFTAVPSPNADQLGFVGGRIAGGMIPKVSCCVKALGKGVKTASIIDGRLDHSLLLEVLTDEGAGTMITG
ncbi:putative acetylglutamate kinase [Helianthus annuus]|nr:putative acetylglutamate kinase [Helianthus annuus]